MPSNSYMSLLVLVLAASTVSVRCAKPQKIEDRGRTSSVQRFGRPTVGDMTPLGYAVVGTLLSLGLYEALNHGESNGGSSRRATQPTSPSEPNNSPRAYVGREERNRSRGLRRIPATRTISSQDRRTPSLSNADLAKGLILFSRMLDELD